MKTRNEETVLSVVSVERFINCKIIETTEWRVNPSY
jgi:hypothetical protein